MTRRTLGPARSGSAEREDWAVVIDEGVDDWQYTGLYAGSLLPGEERGTVDRGSASCIVVPLSGSVDVRCTESSGAVSTVRLTGRASVFDGPTDVAYVPRDSDLVLETTEPCRVALAVAVRARRAGRPGSRLPAPRERPTSPSSCAGPARRPARSATSGCPACSTPSRSSPARSSRPPATGARTRRTSTTTHRAGRRVELEEIYYFEVQAADGATEGADPIGYQRVYGTDGPPDRRPRRGAHRRRRPRAARLARPGDGRSRLRPVLPQRHGGTRPGAGLADLRRPGPRLGPRDLDVPARRPATSLGGLMEERDPTSPRPTRPSDSPWPRPWCASSRHQWTERDGERQKLFAGCFGIFGHGNVAGIGQALLQNELARRSGDEHLPYVLARNEQAMVHTVGRLRPAEGPPADLGLHRLGRPGLDQHAHRCGAGHDQPDPGAAAAVGHLRDAGRSARCSRSSSSRMPVTSPSTTRSARSRGSSTG